MPETSAVANPQLRCTHTHPTGNRCGSSPSAASGSATITTRRAPASRRARATAQGKEPFGLPVLSNIRAIQIALAEVALRIADNSLDAKRAGLLLQCIQTAAATHST